MNDTKRRGDPHRVITELEESKNSVKPVSLVARITSQNFGSISRTQTFVISLITAICVNLAFYYIINS